MKRFKEFSELGITDDYMFCQVMQNESICRRLLKLVLKDEIGEIRELRYQDVRSAGYDARSVRLDVTAGDGDGTVYDIEMQTSDNPNLARRLRYYQAVTDTEYLKRGKDYIELPRSIIIMFCTFDHFDKGLPSYSFSYICEEDKDIYLEDGTLKVLINSRAADRADDGELKEFLELMNGHISDDPFIKEITREMDYIKSDSKRETKYMSYWKEQKAYRDMLYDKYGIGLTV